jgi:hypothetical protein
MGKRRSESNRNRGRRDLARFVLMLLPGFMFVGMLAPAAVSVKPKPEERRYGDPVSFRNFTPRHSIHAPRPLAKRGATPSVEPLFTGARYVAGEAPPLAMELPAVAAGAQPDEPIVLAQEDAVGDYVSDAMFDQSIDSPVLSVDLTPLWNPALFDRIPGTISKGGYTQWDDFHGNGTRFVLGTPIVPIPEPQPGALLALGLLALALRARRANKLR